MALGAGETTPFKLTGAYSAFVNGGHRIEPHLIELVQDREGKTICRADQRDCPRCDAALQRRESPPRSRRPARQVMDPVTAYQITSMLQGVVQRGTATAARVLGRPIGGKTGTTNDYRSAWFVGFSPEHRGRRLRRLRRQPLAGRGRDGRRRGRCRSSSTSCRSALKGKPNRRLQAAQGRQARPGQRHPRGLPPRHRARVAVSPSTARRRRRAARAAALQHAVARRPSTGAPNAGAAVAPAAAAARRRSRRPGQRLVLSAPRGLISPRPHSTGDFHESGCRGRQGRHRAVDRTAQEASLTGSLPSASSTS